MGRIQYRSTSKLVATGIHLTRGLLTSYDKYVLNPFLRIPIAESRAPSYI
jgi:hypothetical protein